MSPSNPMNAPTISINTINRTMKARRFASSRAMDFSSGTSVDMLVFIAGQPSWISDAQTRRLYFTIMKELYDENEVDVDSKAIIRSLIFPCLLYRMGLTL